MTFQLRKADRRQAKLRIGLFGPSGSGKTMSSLKLAHGIAPWDKIAIIDTENGSADLYAHVGPFNVITLTAPFTPERYIEALKHCEDAGMEVVIIDSITHEWAGSGGILEIADQLGKDAKNSYMVWAKITPRHNRFIDAILASRCHVICCGRSKQDYALNQIEKNGKTISVPEKIGLKAITREGFEYEMTVTFDIPISHLAVSTKDRTGLFQDKPEGMLDEQSGVKLKEWAETGAVDPAYQKREIMRHVRRLFGEGVAKNGEVIKQSVLAVTGLELVEENFQAIIDQLVLMTPEEAQKKVGPPKPPGGSGSAPAAPGSSEGTPPANSSPGASGSDKPGLSEAEQAEIAAMAFGGAPTPPAPTPEAPVASPVEKPSTTASDVLAEYQKQIAAADSVDKLNEVYGLITLDKRVIGSIVLDRALKGLVEKRTNEILGIPEKAPEPQVAAPTPEQPPGKCPSCDGKGVTPAGADCAACDGTGIPKHA